MIDWNDPHDLGQIQLPPLPQYIFLQARDTGEWFVLTHSGETGALVASISTELPDTTEVYRYEAPSGPVLDGRVRLYVVSTCLGAELVGPDETAVYTPPVWTRRGLDHATIHITAPRGWMPGDPLTLTEYSI